MTVSELIAALSAYPGDRAVVATWEGTFREVSVYQAKNGIVVIDADSEFYRDGIEKGEIHYLIPYQ